MIIGDGVPTGTAQPAMRFHATLAPSSSLEHDDQVVVTAATRSSTDVIPRIKDPADDDGNQPRRKASRTQERAQRSLKFQIGTLLSACTEHLNHTNMDDDVRRKKPHKLVQTAGAVALFLCVL